MAAKIRKNDMVLILAGKERGKRGKVARIMPKENRAIVEGLNLVKRHIRPTGVVRSGGIIEREAPLHFSNLMLVCNKCDRPVRPAFKFLDDGSKVRVCRHCGEVVD